MRFLPTAALALTSVIGASALPAKRQTSTNSSNIDPDILQYALILEHLEVAFYTTALSMWNQSSFTDAGFPAMFYNELQYISHDEQGHVTYLEAALTAAGATPVAPCNYSFPMSTPKDFIIMASVIEGVGVSAYLGAAPNITSKKYLTVAGSILVTEALHQAATRGAVGEIPMANVFGTPLGLNPVFTIASTFINSCPSSNAPLPVKAYPQLTLVSRAPTSQNATITLSSNTMNVSSNSTNTTQYVTFVSGLDIIPVLAQVSGNTSMAAVPPGVSGQAYVFLTSDNSGNITDATVVAGPAILEVTPTSPLVNITVTSNLTVTR